MKIVPIKGITLDADGSLAVFPDMSTNQDFSMIWRDASGIRWDETDQSLTAAEPGRWQALVLFKQVLCAVANEYGVELHITPATVWSNVPEDLRQAIADFQLSALGPDKV